MNQYQTGGRQGALRGLRVERTLADRIGNGAVVVGVQGGKADVQDPYGDHHSVKSNHRSQDSRLEAKSYATCPNSYPELVPYYQARVNGDREAEQAAAEQIAERFNTGDRCEQLIRKLVTGNDPKLTRFTVYQEDPEDTPDDLVGYFRSYLAEGVIQYLAENLHWEAEAGRRHWNINARLPGFGPIALSIGLGSPKRRLVLFTLRNVPKQTQFWEQHCHVPCVEMY